MASDLSAGCCPDLGNVTCGLTNDSACTAVEMEERPFDMPWWASLSWTVAFVLMLTIAIGGNSLVCWIILGHKHMRTVTNYFLVNLSIANLLMSCLNCSFNFVYMVNADWPFGLTYCIISNFFANFTVAASVLTLMAVAMERYLVIVHPLSRRIRKCEAISCIVFIWLSSAGLSTPCLLYSTIVSHRYPSGREVHGCILVWPDGPQMASFTDYVYNMIFLALTYILPMMAMAVSYTIIGRQLWGAQSIGVRTDRQMASIKSKRKIVRMFIIVVTTFALSWLPYQVYFVYTYHDTSLAQADYVQHLFLAFYWLAMSYSMVNPLIYFWMNRRFRLYLIRWCQCTCFSGGLDYVKTVVSRVDSVVVIKGRWNSTTGRVTSSAVVRASSVTGASSRGRARQPAAVPHGRGASLALNRGASLALNGCLSLGSRGGTETAAEAGHLAATPGAVEVRSVAALCEAVEACSLDRHGDTVEAQRPVRHHGAVEIRSLEELSGAVEARSPAEAKSRTPGHTGLHTVEGAGSPIGLYGQVGSVGQTATLRQERVAEETEDGEAAAGSAVVTSQLGRTVTSQLGGTGTSKCGWKSEDESGDEEILSPTETVARPASDLLSTAPSRRPSAARSDLPRTPAPPSAVPRRLLPRATTAAAAPSESQRARRQGNTDLQRTPRSVVRIEFSRPFSGGRTGAQQPTVKRVGARIADDRWRCTQPAGGATVDLHGEMALLLANGSGNQVVYGGSDDVTLRFSREFLA